MTFWKLLTYINWLLISLYGALVLYMLVQMGSSLGHELKDMGTVVKGVAILLLFTFVGLNWLPYHWTKILVFLLEMLLLALVYNLTTD